MQEASLFVGGVVAAKVGKAGREIYVHQELLKFRSPYFKRVLARPGSTDTRSISLPDVHEDTFCRFLSWLYASCFTLSDDDKWIGLCKLWLLAERFQVPSLQNQVVELLSCRLYQRDLRDLDLETLHYVYDNTGPGSKLRLLFVHISMWYGNQDVFAQMIKDMPPVFAADHAAQQAERASKLAQEMPMNGWDLTGFLLPEATPAISENSTKVESGLPVKTMAEAGIDHTLEDRDKKRKRIRVN